MVKNKLEDDDYMVPDGGRVKVPMVIMDGRPHFADLTHEVRKLRQEARDEYVQKLSDAWRSPRNLSVPDKLDSSTTPRRQLSFDAAQAKRNSAYHQMVAKLGDAWRSPPHRDASEPDNSSPAEVMRRHLRTEPDADDQDRRDAAYSAYKDRISNAWKSSNRMVTGFGPTGPVGAGPDDPVGPGPTRGGR